MVAPTLTNGIADTSDIIRVREAMMKKLLALVALGSLAMLGVTACASVDDKEPTSSPTAETQTPTESSTPNADADVRGSNGIAMPEGWPESVPTLNAPIIRANIHDPGANQKWTVAMQVPDATAGYNEARQLLLDAGFAVRSEESYQEGLHGFYVRTPWLVELTSHDTATPNVEYWLYSE